MTQNESNNRVSIIVPMHNAEKYILATIESVMRQSYEEWELLLVDDCSTDRTVEMVRTVAGVERRIRLIFLKENIGAARTRNKGLQEAEGRYIAYLDADDIWRPDKLEKQLEYMKERHAAFSFTGYEFADESGKGTNKVVKVPETLNYKQALQNTTIFTSTVIFDTEQIEKQQLEMPVIKSEDTALWWKVLNKGYTAFGLNENLVYYRRAGKSLSSNKLEALRRIWNLYRKAAHLSVPASMYNFVFWALRAVKRRV